MPWVALSLREQASLSLDYGGFDGSVRSGCGAKDGSKESGIRNKRRTMIGFGSKASEVDRPDTRFRMRETKRVNKN